MVLARGERLQAQSANKADYEKSFLYRSHRILSMGYTRLDAPSFSNHEEEDITGELARAMQEFVQDPSAPRWAKHFWPSEETRIHEEGRSGKRRRRIDIEIMQHGISPRRRFRFEAKRLRNSTSHRDYLGKDGLGCFLDGRYAREDQIAGMLGYVQEGSIQHQASCLADSLEADPKKHAVAEDGKWTESRVVKDLSTFRSVHNRTFGLSPIALLHTLLLFC